MTVELTEEKRARGRPRVPLAIDRDRYVVALLLLQSIPTARSLAGGGSVHSLQTFIAAAEEPTHRAFPHGRKLGFAFASHQAMQRLIARRATLEKKRQRCLRYQDDREWVFWTMVGWAFAIYGADQRTAALGARICCERAGELPFFETTLAGIIANRFEGGPKLGLKDLFPKN